MRGGHGRRPSDEQATKCRLLNCALLVFAARSPLYHTTSLARLLLSAPIAHQSVTSHSFVMPYVFCMTKTLRMIGYDRKDSAFRLGERMSTTRHRPLSIVYTQTLWPYSRTKGGVKQRNEFKGIQRVAYILIKNFDREESNLHWLLLHR